MDTVALVATVASNSCFQGSLYDSSAFHHILLHPTSWPLFSLNYRGVDNAWCVLPLGFCESLYVYHSLSEAKVAYYRSRGILALAHLDNSWLSKFQTTHGKPERDQLFEVAEAIHVAIVVSFMCGYVLSVKKCDLRPKHKYSSTWGCCAIRIRPHSTSHKTSSINCKRSCALASTWALCRFAPLNALQGNA